MNGGQDLGGVHGFGPVQLEPDEPVFHAGWEKRVLAMTLAMGAAGAWNIDMSRHARENRPPHRYLAMSYYEIWLAGLTALLLAHDFITPEELQNGHARKTPRPVKHVLKADEVPGVLAKGGPCDRLEVSPPAFKDGDRVRAKRLNPTGHTRLPRYARGAFGTIHRFNGTFVFPDANAAGRGELPQPCYSVKFAARDLWGADADPNHAVYVDLWESYLEPA